MVEFQNNFNIFESNHTYFLYYRYMNTETKESRALVIGDFHFGTKTNSTQWLDCMLQYFHNAIYSKSMMRGVDKIIFLGDLFDVRYSTNTLIGIKVKDEIRHLISSLPSNVQVHILAGNHDYYSGKKEDMHYNVYEMVFGPEFLKEHGNIHIYTENPYLDEDGDLYLPWFFSEDDDLYYQTMEHYKGEKINRIFCHSDLQTWDKSKLLARGNAWVYSGHIHTPWKDEENKLWNVGSALSLNFNDVNEHKHIYVLDGNRMMESITNVDTPIFLRYFNEQIFHLDKFENCFVQLYIDKDKVNKAEYIEKCKELKLNNPGISIRVVTVDKDMMSNIESGIDMNQDIKKYIDNNIPDNLSTKYQIIKKKIKEREK